MFTQLAPETARERLQTYMHSLARSGLSPIEHGWRVEAGMRFLRELNARPPAIKSKRKST
jgi:hypothetical protein